MLTSSRTIVPRAERGPLRVLFVTTSMDVGGAETLLVELIRGLDRQRFVPELCCLKHLGPLGEMLAHEAPVHAQMLSHKRDVAVLGRLTRLFRERQIDAVVTVGTGGDKMFWGRLAAWRAGVPVVASALHSTGLPDRVEWLNRRLAPWTDAFIAVAEAHGRYIADHEGCPDHKVRVVPNGVDVERFRPRRQREDLRAELGLPPGAPVAGIVAALRPEKDHELFLRVAARVRRALPNALFLIVGDGHRRPLLESLCRELYLADAVQFLGTRSDVPDLLALMDVVVLTSKMEANPVSILEAMASAKPVIAPRVGSIPESVRDGATGLLAQPGDEGELARYLIQLLSEPELARQMGQAGRAKAVREHSLARMVAGYQDLIEEVYDRKAGHGQGNAAANMVPDAIETRCHDDSEAVASAAS